MGVNAGTIGLVTGGAQGIGRSFVDHLLANGAKVAIGDLKTSVGLTAKDELNEKYPGKVIFVPCDVTNKVDFEAAIKAVIDLFGSINLIINNAGILDERDTHWELMININAVAVARGTKLGFKYMGKNNGGQGGTIVNVASIASFSVWDVLPVYSATKAFVNQFTRNYGTPFHYDQSSVKVMSICPGVTNTALVANATGRLLDDTDRVKKAFEEYFIQWPTQTVDNLGRSLITVLRNDKNGSMWVIEDEEDANEMKVEYSRV